MKKFRWHHLIDILCLTDSGTLPLDAVLRFYFREHKAVGSKDRAEICDTIYGMIRWKGLLDYLCHGEVSWEKRAEIYLEIDPEAFLSKEEIPLHVRLSFPKWVLDKLIVAHGEERAIKFCLESNRRAPTTVRVNGIKTTRDELFEKWESTYEIRKTEHSPFGIHFEKRINFFGLPEFKAGLFEVQDEGSQIVASHVKAKGGDHVLDYCAGSGGKTLAIAPQMGGKGQVYLYDIRPAMLIQAKKRLKRAGIENAQLLDKKKLKKRGLLGRMDWILLDVPCSGSGTLRRNPDMKWRWDEQVLPRLIEEQRKIFDETLKFLHPKGKIVYATCSVFPEENENQIAYFAKEYGMKQVGSTFLSFPRDGEMDGFFCTTLGKS